ncbi:sensor histidine kinase [Taibaiella koreensis]|uniref:sensor histidine kinase n=1 Tax=Taibaiella koreensis TaxID=1268548 RepID=UPI000E59F54C|nr:histidine kinase [Taibaiella koreensis]
MMSHPDQGGQTRDFDPRRTYLYIFLFDRRFRFPRHALVILILMLAFFSSFKEFRKPEVYFIQPVNLLYIFLLPLYTNMYFLVPRFLFRGKYFRYVLLAAAMLVLLLIGALLLDRAWDPYRVVPKQPAEDELQGFLALIILFAVFLLSSTALKLFKRWIDDSITIHELEKYRVESELNQLKNQITPHFLFNMLNNINVLTHRDHQKASELLFRLSDLLRYQLYDSAKARVFLNAEIRFLEDFLTLEKIRKDHFRFKITVEGNPDAIVIPPFLFITFVENAIKHNVFGNRIALVDLLFRIEKDHLLFLCINSKRAAQEKISGREGGLGLLSVNRWLDLNYGRQYELEISETDERFSVTLKVPL